MRRPAVFPDKAEEKAGKNEKEHFASLNENEPERPASARTLFNSSILLIVARGSLHSKS